MTSPALQINQTDTDVFIEVKFRTLVPTFGKPFGAQLLDLYVHNPAATTTSTAAAFPQRNYTIAQPDAWNERVEVQGFASLVWLDPAGNGVGSAVFVPDDGTQTANDRAADLAVREGRLGLDVHRTFTPAGVDQATELDPTRGAVVLQGVTVP